MDFTKTPEKFTTLQKLYKQEPNHSPSSHLAWDAGLILGTNNLKLGFAMMQYYNKEKLLAPKQPAPVMYTTIAFPYPLHVHALITQVYKQGTTL